MKTIERATRLGDLEEDFLKPNFVYKKIRNKREFFEENYIGPKFVSAKARNVFLRKLCKGMPLNLFYCSYIIIESRTPKYEIVRYFGNEKKYWNYYWKSPFILIGSRYEGEIATAFLSGTIKGYQSAPYDWTKRLSMKTTFRVATILDFERFLSRNFVFHKETNKMQFMKENCIVESWYDETTNHQRLISNLTESEVFDDQLYLIYVITASKSEKYEVLSDKKFESPSEVMRLSQAFRYPFFIINSEKGVLINRYFWTGNIKGFDFLMKTKAHTTFFKK